MAILKCKMCGGDLQIKDGDTVAECEYCGTRQTVPTLDNEKKVTLFGRANRLRFACEFDKAATVYESIIADFPEEAEAYWGLVLCKYGIEYVDDPTTAKKIPTCHRSSFDSVMDDSNFDQALENADSIARLVYREEAKQIENLRKGIVEVSSKEESYDIFICYKETDEHGDRTIDSVIAQDVYNALTEKGYRVFFSRITLEDKLGKEYEPYIFAALNSAKVMLAFGTNYEYFNAVWVKNEWSRYLKLIASGQKKTLIPCYKDIDAYDIPKEFAKLQAQDMGKVGAIQDLLRGIEKILPKSKQESKVVETSNSNPSVTVYLKRAYIPMEDADFTAARGHLEKALDIDPENGEIYFAELLIDLRLTKSDDLAQYPYDFSTNANYKRALRYGNDSLKESINAIYQRNVKCRLLNAIENIYCKRIRNYDSIYNEGKDLIHAQSEEEILKGKELLESISGWKDAKSLIEQCDAFIEAVKQAEQQHEQDFQIAKERVKIFKDMISAGNRHIAAVKSDGTALAVGDNRDNQRNVFDWKDIVAIAAGGSHTVGLKSNGAVVAAGDNEAGQCNVSGWKGIVAIEAGGFYTFGLKSDGTVVVAKNSNYQQRNVSGWKDIVAIAAGYHHTVGLKSDGTVVAVGENDDGQCNVSEWKDIVAIAAGDWYTVGLKSDGTVVAVGENKYGQCEVSDWKDIVAIAAGTFHTVGLKSDGTVVVALKSLGVQRHVLEWKDIVAIAARHFYTVGLKSDGTVVAVGLDDSEKSKISEWKLFENVDSLIKAREDSRKAAEEKKHKAEEQRKIKARKLVALQKEKAALMSELNGLGLFAFARKKEIKERVAQIDVELRALK